MSSLVRMRRQRVANEPDLSLLRPIRDLVTSDAPQALASSTGHSLGAFAIQRCGPVPCDCADDERAAYEHDHDCAAADEQAHANGSATGHMAAYIQRAPDDSGGAATNLGGDPLGGDQTNGADPLSAGSNGSTTVHAPTTTYDSYSAPTLAALDAILPSDEVGHLDFAMNVSSSGDPITSARLDVTQVMTMPRWTEYSSQCQPVKQAWDRFYAALLNHERGHVTRDNQQFPGKHARFVGHAQSETQAVTDQVKAEVQAVQDSYDTATDHGRTQNPPTVLDTSPTCAPTGARSDLGAPDLGNETVPGGDTTDTTQTMQASRADGSNLRLQGDEIASNLQAVVGAGGGQPLDDATRAFMEPRFGHDFGRVRVHTDDVAARTASSARSLAFTVGSDIVFGAGQLAPQTESGRHLLAHELTHVVQQSSGPVAGTPLGKGLTISDPSDSYEQAAETNARAVMSGQQALPIISDATGQAQRQVQRQPDANTSTPTILSSSISPDYARSLSDAELERQVSLLRTTLAGMNQSDDLYHGGQENLSVLENEVSERSLGKLAEQGDEFDPYSDPYQQYCSATETLASMGKPYSSEPQGVGIPAGQLVVVDDSGQLQLVPDDDFVDLEDDVFPTLDAIADASQGLTLPDIGLGQYFEQIVLWNDGRALITPMVGADLSLLFISGIGMSLDGAGGVTGIEKPWDNVRTNSAQGMLTGNLYQLGSHPISQFNGVKLPPGSRVRFSDPAFALSPLSRGKMPKIDTRYLTIFNKANKKYYAWDHHSPVGKVPHPDYHINSEGMHADMKLLLGSKAGKGHYEVPPNLLGQAKGLRYIRVGGRVCLVVGIIIDGALMIDATQQSIDRGDARPVIAQAIRTVGGWGGAWAGAKAGCAVGAAAGVETGPGMAITCLAGGVIGGFVGYFVADEVADAIYEN